MQPPSLKNLLVLLSIAKTVSSFNVTELRATSEASSSLGINTITFTVRGESTHPGHVDTGIVTECAFQWRTGKDCNHSKAWIPCKDESFEWKTAAGWTDKCEAGDWQGPDSLHFSVRRTQASQSGNRIVIKGQAKVDTDSLICTRAKTKRREPSRTQASPTPTETLREKPKLKPWGIKTKEQRMGPARLKSEPPPKVKLPPRGHILNPPPSTGEPRRPKEQHEKNMETLDAVSRKLRGWKNRILGKTRKKTPKAASSGERAMSRVSAAGTKHRPDVTSDRTAGLDTASRARSRANRAARRTSRIGASTRLPPRKRDVVKHQHEKANAQQRSISGRVCTLKRGVIIEVEPTSQA